MSEREITLQRAHVICLQGDYQRAYEIYDALLQTYPHNSQVFLEYGIAVYMEFENLEKALRLFEQAFEHDPRSIEALLWQADVAALGYGPEQAGAVRLYRQAIEQDSSCVDAYIGLGLQYQAPSVTLSLEETIDAFRTALALDPNRADAARNLGMALLNKHDTVRARAAFLHAIDLLQSTDYQNQIPGIRRYIAQIDRHETITTRASVHFSPRIAAWRELPKKSISLLFRENDVVQLKHAIAAQSPTAWPGVPSVDLAAGERGAIVAVYTNDSVYYEYEVEFVDEGGMTRALLQLKEEEIEPVE